MMNFLGDDWQLGADGLRYRHAARILVFDRSNRLLLAQGHDPDNPSRTWWFTIGGGQDPEEGASAAAIRELLEETGILLTESALIGPVLTRTATFDFVKETVRQYEKYFVAHLHEPVSLNTSGWTAVEQAMIQGLKWWHLEDLAQSSEQIYPEGLPEIASRLSRGWDGELIHLGDVHDQK